MKFSTVAPVAGLTVVLSATPATGQRWSAEHRYTGRTVTMFATPLEEPGDHRQEQGELLTLELGCNASGWHNRSGSNLLSVIVSSTDDFFGRNEVVVFPDTADGQPIRFRGDVSYAAPNNLFVDFTEVDRFAELLRDRKVLDVDVNLQSRGWVGFQFKLTLVTEALDLVRRCLNDPMNTGG